MKIKNLLFASICLLLANLSFTSCSSDDDRLDDNGSKIELPQTRAFILNEGSYKLNNANITFYNPVDNKTTAEIYYKQNSANLGDTGQDMIEYKGNIYVAIYGSNYITKMNAACVEQTKKSFAGDAVLGGGVRYLAAENGYIYASFYGGAVAKLDANTLEVKDKITGLGNNLEGIAIANNKLYVANSYTKNGTKYEYKKETFVIDLKTFTKESTISVATNPNQLLEEDDMIFLISWGNYGSEGYSFQMIDPSQNNKVTNLGVATKMTAGNDMVYLVNSVTDWSNYTTTNTFSSYDIKTGKINATSFLKNAPVELASASIYMMSVNHNNGDIYIGIATYSGGNDTVYRFAKDGTYIEKFDCGGQNPKTAIFFN